MPTGLRPFVKRASTNTTLPLLRIFSLDNTRKAKGFCHLAILKIYGKMDKLNLKHFNMQKIPYHYFCRFQTALKSLSECEYGTYFHVKILDACLNQKAGK